MLKEGHVVRYIGSTWNADVLGNGIVESVMGDLAMVSFEKIGMRFNFKTKNLAVLKEPEKPITKKAFDAAFLEAFLQASDDLLPDLEEDEKFRHAKTVGTVHGLMSRILFQEEKDGRA